MHRLLFGPLADPPPRAGLDFATQDYLALADHPDLRAAAASMSTQGEPEDPLPALPSRLAAFLGLSAVQCFASGTAAIRHALLSVLRPGDHAIVDAGAPQALFDAVRASGAQLHRAPSASVDGVERRLSRLARQPRQGRLLIAAPAVSSHAAGIVDLAELSTLARTYGAMLIVDATNDLGAMGPCGGGIAEIQGCAARIDVIVGSFARTFGAAGGYAAFRDPPPRPVLNVAAPLPMLNARIILAALDLVASAEGQRRRRVLHGLSLRLRNHLQADGIKVMGKAAPFVPILLPPETALPRTALLESAGPRVRLLQAPTVPLHAPRWILQLSAARGPADIDDLAELVRDVTRTFDRTPARTKVSA